MMKPKTTTNPFSKENEDTSINMGIVVDMIETVIKTPPLKMGDTGRFHIHTKAGNTLILTAAQLLEGPGKFSTLFFDNFGEILFATKKEWPTFVKYIAKIAIPGNPDETAAVMAGNLFFEKIALTMETTEDKTHLLKRDQCSRLVEHRPQNELYYVLPSAAVSDIINDLPVKANHDDISQAMTVLGLKREKTHTVRVSEKNPIRCWWFIAEKIKEINPGEN